MHYALCTTNYTLRTEVDYCRKYNLLRIRKMLYIYNFCIKKI